MTAHELLAALWRDYVASTPQAQRIQHLLTERGELLRNDHVELRTFAVPGIASDALARPFEAAGWCARERYQLAGPHVRACYWQHPEPAHPKLLITELVVDELSPAAQATIAGLIAQLPAGFGARDDLAWAGRPWHLAHPAYRALLAESEHAAWVAAFGFRVHHFAVDLGSLHSFPDLAALAAFLGELGFTLDDADGAIKGTPADHLERSATRADAIAVAFDDATVRIPSCAYEFARRYRLPSGELFHGFGTTGR